MVLSLRMFENSPFRSHALPVTPTLYVSALSLLWAMLLVMSFESRHCDRRPMVIPVASIAEHATAAMRRCALQITVT